MYFVQYLAVVSCLWHCLYGLPGGHQVFVLNAGPFLVFLEKGSQISGEKLVEVASVVGHDDTEDVGS